MLEVDLEAVSIVERIGPFSVPAALGGAPRQLELSKVTGSFCQSNCSLS